MEPRFDWKVFASRKKAVRMERPFRMDGPSEWKAVPCVHAAAKTPNRMSADLVGFDGFESIWGFDRLYRNQNDTKADRLKYVDFFGHPK